MRRNPTGGRSLGVQQTRGCAMQSITRVAFERALDGRPDDRVDELRWIVGGQHLDTYQTRGKRRRLGHRDGRYRRGAT
jgi:hypothetical protein